MKVKYLLSVLIIFIAQIAIACPVCEKQQPKITQGLTHGAGPQSDWDWVIIAIITLITVLTLIYSIKYLLKPGRKIMNHVKQSILSN